MNTETTSQQVEPYAIIGIACLTVFAAILINWL